MTDILKSIGRALDAYGKAVYIMFMIGKFFVDVFLEIMIWIIGWRQEYGVKDD